MNHPRIAIVGLGFGAETLFSGRAGHPALQKQIPISLAICALALLLFQLSSFADNLATSGTAVIGVNDTIDADDGTPRANAGTAANVNDGQFASRVDTWFGDNDDGVSYVGLVWDAPTAEAVLFLDLTIATFLDGGWFGPNGATPGAGNPLVAADHLLEPTIQVRPNGGEWTTVGHTSDYLSVMDGHGIGGGGNANPTSAKVTFTLNEAAIGITGIRIIGENGGDAGPDANGFLGLFELAVETELVMEGQANVSTEGEAILGINDAADADEGTPFEHAGAVTDLNDGDFSSRSDTWSGGSDNGDGFGYTGIVWQTPRADQVTVLRLTMATFTDGGWFGPNTLSPGAGNPLATEHLIEPTVQVRRGGTWSNVPHVSDYLAVFDGHGIGGGGNSNPTAATATFTLANPVTAIDGIRVIGENGGNAGADANGFIGVFEVEVFAQPIPQVNLAPSGTAVIGVNDAIDSDDGTARANAGLPANLNDASPSSRVDTWFGGNTDGVSYVGVTWDTPRNEIVDSLVLTMATFLDGGWFGANGMSPGAGNALEAAMLIEPSIQVKLAGPTWETVTASSDYLTVLLGHGIGGDGNANPTEVTTMFLLDEPVTGITGIRIIGENGGNAGADANGFIGVVELEVLGSVAGDADNDGLADSWEAENGLQLGVDDAAEDLEPDGLTNLQEFESGTDPNEADTDGDGLTDGEEVATHMTNPLVSDTDADGLSDGDETSTHGTNPLEADSDGDGISDGDELLTLNTDPLNPDSDGDGFTDAVEVDQGSDPNNPAVKPSNLALDGGTGIIGTSEAIDGGAATPLEHVGVAANIVDGDPTSRVDTFGGGTGFSYVGVLWEAPRDEAIGLLRLNMATFFDGGWFGVSGEGPGSGGMLDLDTHLEEPLVQVTSDGGDSWNTVGHRSNYLEVLDQHPLPAVDFGPPTNAVSEFVLDTVQSGINGIRIVGPDGGTASDGFIGIFELEVEAFSGSRTAEITSIRREVDSVHITFLTDEPDSPHVLEQSDSLLGASWVEVTEAELSAPEDDDQWLFTATRPEDARVMFYRVRVLPPPPLFAEDFENGADGWVVETSFGDTPWEIGEPVSSPGSASSGSVAAVTSLDGDYGSGLVTALRSPVIDLTGIARPRLRFWYWLNIPDPDEGGQLRFLDADGEVLVKREAIFTGDSGGWQPFNEVIPAGARDRAIIVELRFLTDEDDEVGPGMAVDDFVIED